MFTRLVCIVSLGCLFQLFSERIQIAKVTGNQVLTEDQALSLLRSNVRKPADIGFVVVRKFEATSGTKNLAQRCWDEAQSKHLKLYGGGVLVNLLRTGGFVVLEYDAKTDMATRLHLVTVDETGKPVIESGNVDGELSKSEALELSRSAEAFTDAFLTSTGSQIKELWRTRASGVVPTFDASGGQGYFAIPVRVAKFTNQPDELMDLSVLSGALQVWPIRHALSLPIYAASPSTAVEMARTEQAKLEKEFLDQKKRSPDFVYHLLDLESIDTHDRLRERLEWLKELNSFLDLHCPSPVTSTISEANVSISLIPLKLGVMKEHSDRVFAAMSAPGLISIWTREETGKFVLKDVSEAE